jgi:hypothetical protein
MEVSDPVHFQAALTLQKEPLAVRYNFILNYHKIMIKFY